MYTNNYAEQHQEFIVIFQIRLIMTFMILEVFTDRRHATNVCLILA